MKTFLALLALCFSLVNAAGHSSSGEPWERHLDEGYDDSSATTSDSFLAWSPFHLGEMASGRGEYHAAGDTSTSHQSHPMQSNVLLQHPYSGHHQQEMYGRNRRPPPRGGYRQHGQQDNTRSHDSASHEILSQIINRPHLEDAHITGVNDRQEQESEDELEQKSEENEGEDDDVEEELADPIRTPPLPNLTKKEERALFERQWNEMGLSFALPAGELALRVGEMKLITNFVGTMGRLAANVVKKFAPNEDYIDLYRLYSARYTRKMRYLRKKYRQSPRVTSLAQRDRLLWNNFRKILPKDYLNDGNTMQPHHIAMRSEGKRERRAVWANFVRDKILPRNPNNLDPRSLSIKLFEQYSRDYATRGHEKRETTEIIKKYLIRELGKSQTDLDEFTIRRLEYRSGNLTAYKAMRRIRMANNEDVEDIDEILQELAEEEAYLDADEID